MGVRKEKFLARISLRREGQQDLDLIPVVDLVAMSWRSGYHAALTDVRREILRSSGLDLKAAMHTGVSGWHRDLYRFLLPIR